MRLIDVAEDTPRRGPAGAPHGRLAMPPSRTRPARPILEVGSRAAGDLLDRLRSGDGEAFTEVPNGWSLMMLRIARTFVSTQASAEDILQETWPQTIRGLAGFEGPSSPRTWVLRIQSNQAKTRGNREDSH